MRRVSDMCAGSDMCTGQDHPGGAPANQVAVSIPLKNTFYVQDVGIPERVE